MEYVDKARAELKKTAEGIPELMAVCQKNNLPADLVLGGGGLVVLLGLVIF